MMFSLPIILILTVFLQFINAVPLDNKDLQDTRISEKKCKEYQLPVYDIYFERNVHTGKNVSAYIYNCPHDLIPFITGGGPAALKEFAHMALIGSSKIKNLPWICGGTLISDEYVLSAAHCEYLDVNKLDSPDIVRLGDLNYNSIDDGALHEDFDIVKIFTHENYAAPAMYNDVTLMKLNRKVIFSRYIRPACLSTRLEDYTLTYAIATGWGTTVGPEGSQPSPFLKKVTMQPFDFNRCYEFYKSIEQLQPKVPNGVQNISQICFGSYSDSSDTCRGDSGGPLQIRHPEYGCMYSVIGITSFGYHCGKKLPGIYVKVYHYLDWIEKIVWPN